MGVFSQLSAVYNNNNIPIPISIKTYKHFRRIRANNAHKNPISSVTEMNSIFLQVTVKFFLLNRKYPNRPIYFHYRLIHSPASSRVIGMIFFLLRDVINYIPRIFAFDYNNYARLRRFADELQFFEHLQIIKVAVSYRLNLLINPSRWYQRWFCPMFTSVIDFVSCLRAPNVIEVDYLVIMFTRSDNLANGGNPSRGDIWYVCT